MSIDASGWFSWAIRDDDYPSGTNGGRNPVLGVVLHSAEGNFRDLKHLHDFHLGRITAPEGKRASWMATNLKDGRFVQHFSIYSQTWTSGAAFPNNNFPAWENEGVAGEPLTDKQDANNIRAIREISAGRWAPRRPRSSSDRTATLWEHNEMVRWGAAPTACPSGRIDWKLYLDALNEEDDVRSFLAWCAEEGKVYFVGPNGATWIPGSGGGAGPVFAELERTFGPMTVTLTKAALSAIGVAK